MFPAKEELLMKFVAYLAQSIKHSSMKCYLAAVRHLHIRMGYELDLKKIARLQLVCRGVKRSQGDHTRVRLLDNYSPPATFLCSLSSSLHQTF